MITGEILITGGCGALGRAIIKRANDEAWDCRITVYSRDAMKQHKVKNTYPDVGMIVGDIRDITTLTNAMVGKDCVLHLAAQKHIPEAEYYSTHNYEVNVTGSLNVCIAAMELRIPKVLGISTDKVCHAVNAYGSSKYTMEKIFAEYSRLGLSTSYHLVRLGNVLESTGSVLEVWKDAVSQGKPIRITDPAMTRFWLSPQQAVTLAIDALKLESGMTLIPKMPALSIGKLAEYTLDSGYTVERVPLRPGEKMHEELLTIEETEFAIESDEYFFLHPTTFQRVEKPCLPYSSDIAPELTQEELAELLQDS
jgi:UDP-N-acetylglucosamine 4,6-dehydratase/5-epimerase